jgi:hypothetical protein
MITELEELKKILKEHKENCGDNRGRDGEYLDKQATKALCIVDNLLFDPDGKRMH